MPEDDRLRSIEARLDRIEAYLSSEDDFEAAPAPVEIPDSPSGLWIIETRIRTIGGASQWEAFAQVESKEAAAVLLAADVDRRVVVVPVAGAN